MSKKGYSGSIKGHVMRCFGFFSSYFGVNCDNLSQLLP